MIYIPHYWPESWKKQLTDYLFGRFEPVYAKRDVIDLYHITEALQKAHAEIPDSHFMPIDDEDVDDAE